MIFVYEFYGAHHYIKAGLRFGLYLINCMTTFSQEVSLAFEQEPEFCPEAPKLKPMRWSVEETDEDEDFSLGEMNSSDGILVSDSSDLDGPLSQQDRHKLPLLCYLDLQNRRKSSL